MTKSMNGTKNYSELIKLGSFRERFLYLQCKGTVGEMTFGGRRELNQTLYSLPIWKRVRREVILRDSGCDLGLLNYPIHDRIYIHHINPITIEDVLKQKSCVFEKENLISVSFRTHNAIHYGDLEQALPIEPVIRTQNDTIPWR